MDALTQIREYEQDNAWFRNHKDELRRTYANRFVAVLRGRVIGSGEDLDLLIKEISKQGVDTGSVLFEFVSSKDITVIY